MIDEPLASLDAQRKAEVLPFIQRLCREFSLPILYVSHVLEEIRMLASELVLLEQGHVKASGPVAEVLAH